MNQNLKHNNQNQTILNPKKTKSYPANPKPYPNYIQTQTKHEQKQTYNMQEDIQQNRQTYYNLKGTQRMNDQPTERSISPIKKVKLS